MEIEYDEYYVYLDVERCSSVGSESELDRIQSHVKRSSATSVFADEETENEEDESLEEYLVFEKVVEAEDESPTELSSDSEDSYVLEQDDFSTLEVLQVGISASVSKPDPSNNRSDKLSVSQTDTNITGVDEAVPRRH